MEFSDRLREALKESGLTQKDLAEKAGITEAAVSHYLKGDRLPRAAVASRIAYILGTSSDYLMSGTAGDKDAEILEAKRLIARNVKNMSIEERMEIIHILTGKDETK